MRTFVAVLMITLTAVTAQARSPQSDKADEQAIRALFDHFSAAIAARDLNAIMALYSPHVVAFDAFPPREYNGAAAYRKDYEGFFAAYPGPVQSHVSDTVVKVVGSVAYAYGVDHWTVTDAQHKKTEMTFRFTDVFTKENGKWLVVHEHVSFPVDPATGAADFTSKP